MNFREILFERILLLLRRLLIDETLVSTNVQSQQRLEYLVPASGFHFPLRAIVQGPLEETPTPRAPKYPTAYVSFEGGELDLTADTFLSNVIENVSIRIDLLLSQRAGVRVGDAVRDMEFQASDAISDIQSFVTLSNLQTALHTLDTEEHVSVTAVVLSEWEFDSRFRGGEVELLSLIYEIAVSNPQS